MNFNEYPKQRQELLEWFRKEAKPLSQAYEGAVKLITDQDFPGRLNFIAHAIRDICNRLPFVLDPQNEPQRVDYEGRMDQIEKLWPQSMQVDLKTSKDPSQAISISIHAAKQINALIDDHRRRRQTPSNSERLFIFLMRNEPTRADVNQRIVKDFANTQDWFMARTHLPTLTVRDISSDACLRISGNTSIGNFCTTPPLRSQNRKGRSTEVLKAFNEWSFSVSPSFPGGKVNFACSLSCFFTSSIPKKT